MSDLGNDDTGMDEENGGEHKLLREFAHEIRTPLNAMLGFSALLKGDIGAKPPGESEVKDYAQRINTSTKRLLQICERVLDEAVQGHPVVRKEKVDFSKFCVEIVQVFEADAKEHDLNLNYTIADNFPIMNTDPVILYEMLSNLISNAIKFTPKGGMISVKGEVSFKDEDLILIVQDTGKGIPATIMMSMIKGGGMTTSYAHSERKGWGQGIQFVKEKAALLGGTLDIENAMNGGTVACIRLPRE